MSTNTPIKTLRNILIHIVWVEYVTTNPKDKTKLLYHTRFIKKFNQTNDTESDDNSSIASTEETNTFPPTPIDPINQSNNDDEHNDQQGDEYIQEFNRKVQAITDDVKGDNTPRATNKFSTNPDDDDSITISKRELHQLIADTVTKIVQSDKDEREEASDAHYSNTLLQLRQHETTALENYKTQTTNILDATTRTLATQQKQISQDVEQHTKAATTTIQSLQQLLVNTNRTMLVRRQTTINLVRKNVVPGYYPQD